MQCPKRTLQSTYVQFTNYFSTSPIRQILLQVSENSYNENQRDALFLKFILVSNSLAAATKEIGLEVNAHKTKYMTVFQDQNAG